MLPCKLTKICSKPKGRMLQWAPNTPVIYNIKPTSKVTHHVHDAIVLYKSIYKKVSSHMTQYPILKIAQRAFLLPSTPVQSNTISASLPFCNRIITNFANLMVAFLYFISHLLLYTFSNFDHGQLPQRATCDRSAERTDRRQTDSCCYHCHCVFRQTRTR